MRIKRRYWRRRTRNLNGRLHNLDQGRLGFFSKLIVNSDFFGTIENQKQFGVTAVFSIQNIVSSIEFDRDDELFAHDVKILGYGNWFGFDPLPLLISLDMETGLVCPFQQKN
ncbi:hypothetical protein L2E82_35149 [Cichorium intybus]|uniref:Uncharacterized protein n=1 Tax=Cichorium intybus TaxID=13427 RepID=A0ACB9BNG3_CICIN|nr:hypothetical protein L2E82_35149 [Cichorium intybus]